MTRPVAICGWVLAVDPASKVAGVSLWYNDAFVAQTMLVASGKNSLSARLRELVAQLNGFLDRWLPAGTVIRQVIFEGVRSRIVTATVGAFMTCPRIDATLSQSRNFVESFSWKGYGRRHGALGPLKDIKGVRALRDIRFPVDEHGIDSDDVADSVLIYLAWRERQ